MTKKNIRSKFIKLQFARKSISALFLLAAIAIPMSSFGQTSTYTSVRVKQVKVIEDGNIIVVFDKDICEADLDYTQWGYLSYNGTEVTKSRMQEVALAAIQKYGYVKVEAVAEDLYGDGRIRCNIKQISVLN